MEIEIKSFRELSLDELYAIIKLRVDVFVVEQECPYPELDDKDQKSLHVLCWKKGELVAYARLLPENISYPEASIGRFVVRQDQRKHGYGKVLMSGCLDFIINRWGCDSIKIQAQNYLKDFYKSFGFKAITSPYLEDGIPHIDMILNNTRPK
ncbi:GNAT family acetyltransferase [Fulvitalea axinellae]|uniref:GNAT family acetyltransferase n=1 Tax=Fulvitalea axinellae TaxID=1182444 RepID=A0AAU9CRG0_9BACT|nr:GNAT family acetyltransferase [Fulvitalea axinellae]